MEKQVTGEEIAKAREYTVCTSIGHIMHVERSWEVNCHGNFDYVFNWYIDFPIGTSPSDAVMRVSDIDLSEG